MKLEQKRKAAFVFEMSGLALLVAGFILFIFAFPCVRRCVFRPVFSLPAIAWLIPIIAGCVLCLIGAWLQPKFWWGRSRFTTPMKDPSHQYTLPAEERVQLKRSTTSPNK